MPGAPLPTSARRRVVLVVGILLWMTGAVVGGDAQAQGRSADAYFHDAAQQYIAENAAAAREVVQEGLAAHPDDPRLQALKAKLDRSQQQSSPDSSSQGKGGDSQESGEKGPEQNTDGRQGQEEGDDGRRQESDASRDGRNGPNGDRRPSQSPSSNAQQQPDARPDGSPSDTPTDASPNRRGRQGSQTSRGESLSRAQAERILRALQGQEQQLLREVQNRSARSQPVEKDW
jgi:hypothetical protein